MRASARGCVCAFVRAFRLPLIWPFIVHFICCHFATRWWSAGGGCGGGCSGCGGGCGGGGCGVCGGCGGCSSGGGGPGMVMFSVSLPIFFLVNYTESKYFPLQPKCCHLTTTFR